MVIKRSFFIYFPSHPSHIPLLSPHPTCRSQHIPVTHLPSYPSSYNTQITLHTSVTSLLHILCRIHLISYSYHSHMSSSPSHLPLFTHLTHIPLIFHSHPRYVSLIALSCSPSTSHISYTSSSRPMHMLSPS